MITGRFLDLAKPINIHLCKDRTLSYRRRAGRPVFNGVAVPVLSVDTEDEAEALITLVGTTQYNPHPHPKFPHKLWRKLFNGVAGWKAYLDPEDVPEAEEYLARKYEELKEAVNV